MIFFLPKFFLCLWTWLGIVILRDLQKRIYRFLLNAAILLFQNTGWKDEICFISFTICAVTLLLTVHKTQFQGRILLCYNKYFRFEMRNKICFKSRVVICPRAPVTMMFLDTRAYLEQIFDLTPSPHHTFVSSVVLLDKPTNY